jgi:hypothetical protein
MDKALKPTHSRHSMTQKLNANNGFLVWICGILELTLFENFAFY